MAWHWRKRAHLILEVTYKIGEQPELQAVFFYVPSHRHQRIEVPGVLMALLLLVFLACFF